MPAINALPVSFLFPEGLLAGLLLVVLYWRFVRHKTMWRTVAVVCAALLLGYPSVMQLTRNLNLFVVVDRSRSISPEAEAKQAELLGLISDGLRPEDRISVITFNQQAYVEQANAPGPAVREFANPYSVDASNISDAIATAMSLVPARSQSRLFVMSDGEFTGTNPAQHVQMAAQEGLPIYVRDLKRSDVQNLYVAGVEAGEIMRAGEPFRVLFRVNATVDLPGRYRVYRDGRIMGRETDEGWRSFNFRAGENRIAFVDRVNVGGIHGYKIEVQTTPADREKVLADNTAEKFINVLGEGAVLVVNNTGAADNVSNVLTAAGIPVHLMAVGDYRMTINQLAGYKGVVLNNVPLTGMQKRQIDDLRNFVTQHGGGLLVAGGNRSFGAGGYYRTAMEDVLPVSMEDRRQSKRVSAAFSFVLDRSGSMSMPVPTGETKMDLANAAAVESLNLLGQGDSLSVIAVDSAAHIFVEQQPAKNTAEITEQIRRIRSMGGGIFVYTGLLAAASQITQAEQVNKHVLLFADASDAEEPGDYKALIDEFTRAGITVSVVGLGRDTDPDAEFLKDIARRGQGDVYFTDDPQQLIQFFTADTMQHTRNNFVEDAAPVKVLPPSLSISPEQSWRDFTGSGYNLLFPRPGAEVAMATTDEDAAPILAFWQRGVGRAVSLALDTNGSFSSEEQFPDVVLSAVRWMMGSNVNDSFQVKARTDGNEARISMEVSDEQRAAMGQPKLTMFAPDGSVRELPMRWDSWNRLSADVELTQQGAWRGVVQVGGEVHRVPPVSMPVSPEFAWQPEEGIGREALLAMARATGGAELVDIQPLFERQLRSVAVRPLVVPLLILMLVALVGDVAEARFGWWMRFRGWLSEKWRGRRMARRPEVGEAGGDGAETLAGQRSRELRRRRGARVTVAKEQPVTGVRRTAAEASAEPGADERGGAGQVKSADAMEPAGGDAAGSGNMDFLAQAKQKARRNMKEKK